MKNVLKRILFTASFALLLTTSVYAADGLDIFTDNRNMTAATFSDVSASDWFYNGVKNVYDMNLMDGMGNGSFAPSQTVPWSQAVTIAARVRAAYYGEEIPAADGPWYACYVAYAQNSGILPDNHPEGNAWNTTPIDRQSIAYLFQAMVKPEDFPVISDLAIPDLDQVSADKRSAVQFLYSAGVLTGKDGNRFDPHGAATRGELACLLTNLLRPAYRTAKDDRVNADMSGQESNFFLAGNLCYDDQATYMLYRETGEGSREHILRKDEKTGEVTTLFSTSGDDWQELEALSIHNGFLYFTQANSSRGNILTRLSLTSGAVEELCSAPKGNRIDLYTIYDGRIFTVQSQLSSCTIGEVVNGSIRTLTKQDNVDTIYGFDGKLFFTTNYDRILNFYDLSTKKVETLLEGMSCCALTDGKIYYSLWDSGEYSNQIWMASLHAVDSPVKYGTLPDSALKAYVNLNHDGKNLYYLASSSYTLYRIVPGQEAKQVLRTRFPTVECPLIWKDRFFAGNIGLGLSNYTGSYPITTNMSTSNSFTTNVDHWLGYSALMTRTSFPQTSTAYVDNTAPTAEENLVLRKAYYSGNQLILDFDYYNPDTEKGHTLKQLNLTLSAGGVTIADATMGSYEDIRPGQIRSLTVSIQGEDLFVNDADLTTLRWHGTSLYTLFTPM